MNFSRLQLRGSGPKPGRILVRLLGAVIAAALPLIMLASPVYADGQRMTRSFDVDIVVDSAWNYRVTETIVGDATEPYHGITRYIPENSNYRILDLKTTNGDKFQEKSEDGNDVIMIGDEDVLLEGEHTFSLSYTLAHYSDQNPGNTIGIDLFPSGWQTDVDQAKITLTMEPGAVDFKEAKLYAGSYQDTQDYTKYFDPYTVSADGRTLTVTGHNLPAETGLTIIMDLPDNYFSEAVTYAEDHFGAAMVAQVLLVILALICVGLWFAYGRDSILVKPISVRPPDGLTPAEVGYLADGSADDTDMMSMILYFASKGYLKISKYDKKKYCLNRMVTSLPDSEEQFAHMIFDGIFEGNPEVRMNDLPETLPGRLGEAKSNLVQKSEDTIGPLYEKKSWIGRILGCIFWLVGLVAASWNGSDGGAFIGGLFFGILAICLSYYGLSHRYIKGGFKLWSGIFLAAIASMICGNSLADLIGSARDLGILSGCLGMIDTILLMLMFLGSLYATRRSEQYTGILGKIIGFRQFIRVAKYDEIKALVDQNPDYFFDILPYAQVLGLETKWAKKFTNIKLTQPSWYSTEPDDPFLYSPLWVSSLTRGVGTRNLPSSSSGSDSGSSGGGSFSGGGDGGGGGGFW